MKLNDRGSTDFYQLPVEETEEAIAYIAEAEVTDDLATLKRGVRLLMWLYRMFKSDTCGSDEPFEFDDCEFANVQQFNAAWEKEVKK